MHKDEYVKIIKKIGERREKLVNLIAPLLNQETKKKLLKAGKVAM